MNKVVVFFRALVVLVLAVFAFNTLQAQPPNGDGGGEDPDSEIPVDGGISLLAAAGVAYGAHALRKKKTVSE